jgi:hypothetical protein
MHVRSHVESTQGLDIGSTPKDRHRFLAFAGSVTFVFVRLPMVLDIRGHRPG